MWAVSAGVKRSEEVDRPQVCTRDGFVLRRTGGYNIYETALKVARRRVHLSFERREQSPLSNSIAIRAFAPDLKDPRQTHHCFAVCCRLDLARSRSVALHLSVASPSAITASEIRDIVIGAINLPSP